MSEAESKKRRMEEDGGQVALYERLKKPKMDDNSLVLKERKGNSLVLAAGPARTSGLMAPNMKLTGHEGAIYSAKFSPDGNWVASGSHDKLILLWNTYGDCKNWGVLKGHSGAVLDVTWNKSGEVVYSASSDKTACAWDVENGIRMKKFKDHKSHVNSICASRADNHTSVTGSDDSFAMLWDIRARGAVHKWQSEYSVTAVAMAADNSMVFTGGLDEIIQAWDVRTGQVQYQLTGHTDTITGLRLSPDGTKLLSNAMDHTLRIWDVRPYVSAQQTSRHVSTLLGATHDFQKNLLKCAWSPDGSRVSAGSSDNFVNVWDVQSKNMLYKLPGHTGSVSEVDFHPLEPIILSSSSDKTMFVGEISAVPQ